MQDIYRILNLFETSGFKELDVIAFFERLDHFKTQIVSKSKYKYYIRLSL